MCAVLKSRQVTQLFFPDSHFSAHGRMNVDSADSLAATLSWTNPLTFGGTVPRADVYLLINSANASSFESSARMRVESGTCPERRFARQKINFVNTPASWS
jgi:hypothetical protein